MEGFNKCLRCKTRVEKGRICQNCKSELLPYYEATKDWLLACEMEKAQNSVERYCSGLGTNEFSY